MINFLWRLFNHNHATIQLDSTHTIVDEVGNWPVDKAYAEKGVEEGWLELLDYRIDNFNVEHYKYRPR